MSVRFSPHVIPYITKPRQSENVYKTIMKFLKNKNKDKRTLGYRLALKLGVPLIKGESLPLNPTQNSTVRNRLIHDIRLLHEERSETPPLLNQLKKKKLSTLMSMYMDELEKNKAYSKKIGYTENPGVHHRPMDQRKTRRSVKIVTKTKPVK